jgi:hypothetical protein
MVAMSGGFLFVPRSTLDFGLIIEIRVSNAPSLL